MVSDVVEVVGCASATVTVEYGALNQIVQLDVVAHTRRRNELVERS
jgi:hypothetical protein